jgi:Tfp pilus assembly protein FimT
MIEVLIIVVIIAILIALGFGLMGLLKGGSQG